MAFHEQVQLRHVKGISATGQEVGSPAMAREADDDMIEQTIKDIREQLRTINIVSFSGGKDSSATLELVFEALKGTGKRLVIVTSDTMMEIPFYQQYVDGVRDRIADFIKREHIDASLALVRPAAEHSFWVSVLGKGYPAAHMGFRWCTGVLKIDPITYFTKKLVAGQDYMVFVGVRRAESELRAKIYQKKDYKPNHFAPILDWSTADVWTYLLTEACPWGTHEELVKVYRYSSDECVYGEKQAVCIGNARYGCWACPLQKSTQLEMIAHHTNDNRYRLLREFKEILVNMANQTAFRSRIRRNGEEGAGPFLVEVRKQLFHLLKELELKTGWALVKSDEEALIFKYWEAEQGIHNVACADQPMLWPATDIGTTQCGVEV
jgi:DNA sulfur modification protein DndC